MKHYKNAFTLMVFIESIEFEDFLGELDVKFDLSMIYVLDMDDLSLFCHL